MSPAHAAADAFSIAAGIYRSFHAENLGKKRFQNGLPKSNRKSQAHPGDPQAPTTSTGRPGQNPQDRVGNRKRNGYKILLISASPSFLVESIAVSLGIEIYSGTEYLVLKNRYTGKIKGSDCRGPEKIIRIESLINLKKYDLKNSLAFSDSKADIPMLSLAGESWLVDKKIWKLRKFDR